MQQSCIQHLTHSANTEQLVFELSGYPRFPTAKLHGMWDTLKMSAPALTLPSSAKYATNTENTVAFMHTYQVFCVFWKIGSTCIGVVWGKYRILCSLGV